MATATDLSDEQDAGDALEKEISELRSVKKELLGCLQPFNDVLERIARRERECVDKQHHLRAEKHDREKQKQTVEHLIEVESELKHVKSENVKLSDRNGQLKQSLNLTTKISKTLKLRIAELESRVMVMEQELSLANTALRA